MDKTLPAMNTIINKNVVGKLFDNLSKNNDFLNHVIVYILCLHIINLLYHKGRYETTNKQLVFMMYKDNTSIMYV